MFKINIERFKNVFYICLLLCMFFIFSNNNVFAYNLNYEIELDDSEQFGCFRTHAKYHGTPFSLNNWHYYSKMNSSNWQGANTYYSIFGIGFQRDGITSANYSGTGYGTNYNLGYDHYWNYVSNTIDDVTQVNNFSVYNAYVSNWYPNNKNIDLYKIKRFYPDDFSMMQVNKDFWEYRTIQRRIADGNFIDITDHAISMNLLKEIASTFTTQNGEMNVRFSMPIHTTRSGFGYLYTADQAARWACSSGVNPLNKGFVQGTSAINHYDNWLKIPISKINPKKVLIRSHVTDANGNYNCYEENANLGMNEQVIEFSNSSVFTNTSKIYNSNYGTYIGGKMGQGSTYDAALRAAEESITDDKWGWNGSSKKLGNTPNETYYVIDLYYEYRQFYEKHLRLDGNVIDPSLNKITRVNTATAATFEAKIPLYRNNTKYAFVNSVIDGFKSKEKSKTYPTLDGANKFIRADKHDLSFFYEYEPPRKIYVRHFVQDEKTKLFKQANYMKNTSAVLKDSELPKEPYTIVPNGFNQRRYKTSGNINDIDSISYGFDEQYTIDFKDKLILDKSRTIANNGVEYEYQGYLKSDIKHENPVTSTNSLSKENKVEIKEEKISSFKDKTDKKIYIDYYYIPKKINVPGEIPNGFNDEEYPDPNAPTIDFVPMDNSNNKIGKDTSVENTNTNQGKCRTVYVPSGEKLKAYITTPIYRPYSLVYDNSSVDKVTGKPVYKINKYDVYGLNNGEVTNTESSKYGYVNSTSKKGVFNLNSNLGVNPNIQTIRNVIDESYNYYNSQDPMTSNFKIKDGRKTVADDFGASNIHNVLFDKYNGAREASGNATYDITKIVENGSKKYENKGRTTVNTKNNARVNVFTPLSLEEPDLITDKFVNHTENTNLSVIQKDSEFKLQFKVKNDTSGKYNELDTYKYLKNYWLILDFDVKLLDNVKVWNKDTNSFETKNAGSILKAGDIVCIPKNNFRNESFRAIATNGDTSEGNKIKQMTNDMKVIGQTYNVTDADFENKSLEFIAKGNLKYIDNGKINFVSVSCDDTSKYADSKRNHKDFDPHISSEVKNMYFDSHYFTKFIKKSRNIGRVYDFKITDCLDINFKNAFRENSGGDVNKLKGTQYFAGVRKLLVYGDGGYQLGSNVNNKNNIFIDREKYTVSESDRKINDIPAKTIIPFGPYKHIDRSYLQAPKLGYRISFDLKTSGVYKKGKNDSSRHIQITPSYYYISKDGRTYKENVELYYKNSNGRYSEFNNSGYTIYFKPNDGYRTKYNMSETSIIGDMSLKLEPLKIGNKSFELKDNMMSYSENNFVQTWYGEFKLPNSAILVEVIDGKKDINKPLTDGYVGVKFEIKCIDKINNSNDPNDTIVVSYNVEDKSQASKINTTQWDYEGFLGFARDNIGKEVSGTGYRIPLEKGNWDIKNQNMYEKVKSTVVLFDLDNRAANDFE